MELVIDAGNTFTKLGYFSRGRLLEHFRISNDSGRQSFPHGGSITSCIVSATADVPAAVTNFIEGIDNVWHLSHETLLPFNNEYKSPATLGRDRMAGVAGVKHLFPERNALVIDAGTAITYDLIDESGTYCGGRISPGLGMRYRALHQFTGRLPEISHREVTSIYGDDTESSILTGTFQGLVEEVNGTIRTFAEKYPNLVVALCGGDAHHLVNHVNYRIFALPNLILLGLHQILTHNAQQSKG